MRSRVDAHHHLWHYTPEFSWIGDDMRVLRRDFLLEELRTELAQAGVGATVAVQARQSTTETDWLLSLAEAQDSPIQGVVGWLPIASPSFPQILAEYLPRRALRGLRHIVQAEPSGFLDDRDFNKGMRALLGSNLVYDLLVYPHQLPEAIAFLDRHPNQAFVLDHLGKPDIRNEAEERWKPAFRQLAQRPNVACKLSGMVTEADLQHWSPDQLHPYLETALQAFGPDRLMVGSDWPVVTAACSYARWWQVVEQWIGPLSNTEQESILSGCACRWYNLDGLATR